ncbi:MAG TPA: MoaF C-terminal domain-containing protein [Acidiphilium sp.]
MANSPWISVGALAEGFRPDSNSLNETRDLDGRSIGLRFVDGETVEYRFIRDKNNGSIELPGTGRYSARITSLRSGICFIDFLPSDRPRSSMTLLLDLETGSALEITTTLPTEPDVARSLFARVRNGESLTPVDIRFRPAILHPAPTGTAAPTPGFPITDELIGHRIRYRYSPTELYEHIYLNPNFYTWHCLSGVEAGLGDTDRCHYFKLRDRLYLFIWLEKIVPTLGIVTVDLDSLRTDGKILGYADNGFETLVNFPIGALAMPATFTPAPETV